MGGGGVGSVGGGGVGSVGGRRGGQYGEEGWRGEGTLGQ